MNSVNSSMSKHKHRVCTINKHGLAQIAVALDQYYKHPQTYGAITGFASDAEQSFANGFPCEFEIRAWDSNNGRAELIGITPAGYDIKEIDV